ncbi:MAG: hypothetical protein K2N88_08110 [Muribaculaceae bacterium]|nr:hypothetical protein [Muribaculaceae bacterium]
MKHYLLALGSVAAAALLAACTDSAYDLSDIDSETEIKVNNLTVPVNMEAVKLSQVIDLKEGENLKVVDGRYAVLVEGSFSSDPIRINPITIAAPVLNPTQTTLNRLPDETRAAGMATFAVPATSSAFSYFDNDVDPSIKEISVVKSDSYMISLTLSAPALQGVADEMHIEWIDFALPKGLTGTPSMGTYNKNNGQLSISDVTAASNGLTITMPVTEIEAAKAGATLDPATRTFIFDGTIDVIDGRISVDINKVPAGPVDLRIDYAMGELDVKSISGRIAYTVEDVNIPDVDLNDLPDFLRQDGTNVVLDNPQIYLSLENPMYSTRLTASTGLTLTAIRNGRPTVVCSLPNPIRAGADKGRGPYDFCLSPREGDMLADYAQAKYEPFPTLGHILEGQGLPETIRIETVEPGFEEQNVTDLRIGYDYGTLEGSYTFYAPLSLEPGSTILYSDSDTGWGSEDLDKLTIETLTLTATAYSNVPAAVELTGDPLNYDGLAISTATVSTVTIPANAQDYPVEITVTGPVDQLDGFLYKVKLTAGSTETLTPDQNLQLTDIRATVSGKYVTNF